jgi:hypothetical protein
LIMEENSGSIPDRNELLSSIRRLAQIALDRLEQGIHDRTLDPGQVRMLGGLAVRSLRLWHEALGKRIEREALSAAESELEETLAESYRRVKT